MAEFFPVGSHRLSAVDGGASTFDLRGPLVIDVGVLLLVEAVEQSRRELRTIILRKPQRLSQKVLSVCHDIDYRTGVRYFPAARCFGFATCTVNRDTATAP